MSWYYTQKTQSLYEMLQACYKSLGFKEYEIYLQELANSPNYKIVLTKTIPQSITLLPQKYLPEFFEDIIDSPRYKQLIDENNNLKRLLDSDPCEKLNLNWD